MLLATATLLTGCQTPPSQTVSDDAEAVAVNENGIAQGDTSDMRIAFSISFVKESSFRKAVVESFEVAAEEAKEKGVIADVGFFDANQDTQTQIEHIETIVADGYDAVLILANSATELNDAVKAACDAGVVVVDFNGEVTEPCSYTVSLLWEQYGTVQASYLGNRLEKGTLLEVRGVAGTTNDASISGGIHAALADFPQLEIVDSVVGNWQQDVAQAAVAEVLPALPEIDAVVTQGGDGYGTALAFEATDRPLPVIMMGNRHEELKWWQEQRDANGYETVSATAPPGISAVSFWVAQQILAGKDPMPPFVSMPLLVIEPEMLDAWLAVTPEGRTANPRYTLEWTAQLIEAEIAGAPLPAPPLPNEL